MGIYDPIKHLEYNEWHENTPYLMSFGYALISNGNSKNNQSVLLGCYSEIDELAPFNGSFWNHVVTSKTNNLIIGGTLGGNGRIPGYLYNENNVISSQNFKATKGVDFSPSYSMLSIPDSSDVSVNENGGFNIKVQIAENIWRSLNFAYIDEFKAFGFQSKNKFSNSQLFVFKESLEAKSTEFGVRTIAIDYANIYTYPAMRQPMFLKFFGTNISRLFGYTDKNPELLAPGIMPGFCIGDLFLFSNFQFVSKKQLGWRCIEASSPANPNGKWEVLHYFEPAEKTLKNNTPDAGETYSKDQVQGILDEIRELKDHLRTAGILKTT
jgi:hypothetical protein